MQQKRNSSYIAVVVGTRPEIVKLAADTTTTSAGALEGNYAGLPLVHVEAGLQSFDRAMPKELNRCVISVPR